jgi:hypothetical protein
MVDALGSTQNGQDVLWENQPNEQPGSWNGYTPSNFRPVPEQSTWVMMLTGFAGLGFMGWRESRRTAPAA